MPTLLTITSTEPNASTQACTSLRAFGVLRHIGHHADRLAAGGIDLGDHIVDRRLVRRAVDHDRRALLGQRMRDGAADIAARAGDDRGAVLQVLIRHGSLQIKSGARRDGEAPRVAGFRLYSGVMPIEGMTLVQ